MANAVSINFINEQAARWAVEVAHGDTTPESQAELQAWLAADRRHRGAYARACAWLRATEEAVVESHGAPVPPHAAISTNDHENGHDPDRAAPLRGAVFRWSRRAAVGGGALAMSLAALVAIGVPVTGLFQKTEVAAAQNRVALKDGSIATLDHDAQIEVALSDNIRKITLLRGSATFEVAKDRARPFVVRSGDVYAQATGTVYSVSRAGHTGGTVRVAEGSVLVWPRDERDQAVLLHAGGTVTLDPGPAALNPEPVRSAARRLPPPELAQISLDNVPVRSAVARFNRVNTTQIILADAAIGNLEIIGLYRADDPEHFAQAVAAISGGKIEYSGRNIVIKMKSN